MAQKISRRTLAKVISQQLVDGVQTSKLAQAIAAYLISHKMLNQIDMLLGDIAYELSQQEKHLFASVKSTHTLTESLKSDITRYLKAQTGITQVELAEEIDPSLVGGLVIDTPDETMDISVRAKLRRLASVGD